MITKYFYDEEDYNVVLRFLSGNSVRSEDRERVYTRQLFIESALKKKGLK